MNTEEPIYMRPALTLADVIERRRLVNSYIKWRIGAEQIFTDVASWNENIRKPHEAPIDPDPGGELRRICDRIDAFLKSEAQ